jgi:hypothetical protein
MRRHCRWARQQVKQQSWGCLEATWQGNETAGLDGRAHAVQKTSYNVEARTLAAEVSDGAAALQMNVDIANSTTVVVLEHFHL